MNNYYITFRSITGAQRAIKILANSGIKTSLQRTPKNMVTEGCGYAVKVREDKVAAALTMLKPYSINYGKVFTPSEEGYKEVII